MWNWYASSTSSTSASGWPEAMTAPGPGSLRVARRNDDIQPFHVMALLARARELEAQGRDIVHMEIGEPDFATPEPVMQAARAALSLPSGPPAGGGAEVTHYTPALGLPALREALAAWYRDRFGVRVDAARIVITPGASGALLLLTGLLVDRDQQVLMADPGYPCNRHFVRFVEGRAGLIPVGPDTGYQLDARLLAAHWGSDTVAALVATPSNPTGTLIDPAELAAMASFARAQGGYLLVDEIYQALVYGREPASVLSVSDEVFVLNSFSKYFSMTGWRLGWLVAPPEAVPALDRLAQNLFLAASTPAQYAALAALGPQSREILEARRKSFATRRDYLLPVLRELGLAIPVEPQGAFYIYADCSAWLARTGLADSMALATALLENAGVAITPGDDFGCHRATHHLRFAYTTSLERLRQGVERLADFLGA